MRKLSILLLIILISLVGFIPIAYLSSAPSHLKRGELIKMVVLALGETEDGASDCIKNKRDRNWRFVYFRDVKIDNPYAPYICVGFENDLLPNYSKFLKPDKTVTVKESGKVLLYSMYKKGLIDTFDIQSSGPSILKKLFSEGFLLDDALKPHHKMCVDDFLEFLINKLYFPPNTQEDHIAENEDISEYNEEEDNPDGGDGGAERYRLVTNFIPDGQTVGSSHPLPIPTSPPTPASCHTVHQNTVGNVNQARVWPISGSLSSPFGPRVQASSGLYDFHRGVDIPATVGTSVKTIADGTVHTVYLENDPLSPYPNGGTVIVISHENGSYYSLYMHLSQVNVTVSQAVRLGDTIGLSGNSGTTTFDHLHFEVREGSINSASEPHRNPFGYLPYYNTTGHTVDILDSGNIDPENLTVKVQVTAPRDELDINSVKVSVYRKSDCSLLSSKEVDFNKRINSGTDISLQNGIRLSPSLFNAGSSNYVLGVDFSGLTGENSPLLMVAEASDVTGNTVYTEISATPLVPPKKLPDANTRAMWVWGEWWKLKGNIAEIQSFIDFLKAPHGNTAYAVNRIFLSRSGEELFSNPTDVQSMQSFLTTADSNGIDVEILLSDYAWSRTANKQNAIDLCQSVVDFNKSTTSFNDDFKGIHFDIEPHTLPEWRDNTTAGTDEYNDELQANFLDIMTQCRQKIDASGLPLTLSIDVPSNWHKEATDLWPYLTATDSPVDYITIMNYFDSDYRFVNGWGNDVGGVKNNLADANGKPIMFGAEISDVTGISQELVSFYEEGYFEMELAFSSVKSQYGNHPQFSGLAVHHYGSYINATSLPPKYPLHKNITGTYFYVGEPAGPSNGNIANFDSAWDEMWMEHYGGVDDPVNRNGHYPAGFIPLENPFYVALPYSDFDTVGRKANAMTLVYWADEKSWAEDESMIKNRWVKLTKDSNVVYAQWEDSGPFQHDDTAYVFGTSAPLNTENQNAGIDVSPAVNQYLGLNCMAPVTWQFVDEEKVPDGPWKEIVTISGTCWGIDCN